MSEGIVGKFVAPAEVNACQRHSFKMSEGIVGKVSAPAEVNACQRHSFKMSEGIVGKVCRNSRSQHLSAAFL